MLGKSVEEEFYRFRFSVRLQVPFGEQRFVMTDPIAAVILGVIQRLIGVAEDDDWGFLRNARKAYADRDLANLWKCMLLDIFTEALEYHLRIRQGGRTQQDDKFFTAKTEYAILRAER